MLRARLWEGFARLQVLLGGHAGPGRVIERDGLVASVVPAAPDSPTLNAAVAIDPDAGPRHLAELRTSYDEAGIRRWGVWLDGGATDAANELVNAGLLVSASSPGMGATLDGAIADIEPQQRRPRDGRARQRPRLRQPRQPPGAHPRSPPQRRPQGLLRRRPRGPARRPSPWRCTTTTTAGSRSWPRSRMRDGGASPPRSCVRRSATPRTRAARPPRSRPRTWESGCTRTSATAGCAPCSSGSCADEPSGATTSRCATGSPRARRPHGRLRDARRRLRRAEQLRPVAGALDRPDPDDGRPRGARRARPLRAAGRLGRAVRGHRAPPRAPAGGAAHGRPPDRLPRRAGREPRRPGGARRGPRRDRRLPAHADRDRLRHVARARNPRGLRAATPLRAEAQIQDRSRRDHVHRSRPSRSSSSSPRAARSTSRSTTPSAPTSRARSRPSSRHSAPPACSTRSSTRSSSASRGSSRDLRSAPRWPTGRRSRSPPTCTTTSSRSRSWSAPRERGRCSSPAT